MIQIIGYLLLILLGIFHSGYSIASEKGEVLYQSSTINALLNGIYEGELTFKDLKKYGNFGIGTFNSLDGEMIGLNGKFYQIRADGVAYPVGDSVKTPFAVVTFFEPDKTFVLDKSLDFNQINEYLDNLLPTKNIFFAIRINGIFKYIKTRSVHRQNKPYPPLSEALKNQPIFEFHNIKGTLIGFRFPEYMNGVNLPGYHFHFITEDRKAGGHLLECEIQSVLIEIDYTDEFYMTLLKSKDFYNIDLKGLSNNIAN